MESARTNSSHINSASTDSSHANSPFTNSSRMNPILTEKQDLVATENQRLIGGIQPGAILTGEQFKQLYGNQLHSGPLTEDEIISLFSDNILRYMIKKSSYFRKHVTRISPSRLARPELIDLYQKCRIYAAESIIQSLYPVDQLSQPVTHLYCDQDKFRILSRVRTNWEAPTIEDTAAKRAFLSFTLAGHENLSHFPGLVWYGYRTGITPEMIGYISPIDADTISWARDRSELSDLPETLLDADDLISESRKQSTYSQISIKSSSTSYSVPTTRSQPVLPDCILCINTINSISQTIADARHLPIIVLHPSKRTCCNIHDFYAVPELSHPKYA